MVALLDPDVEAVTLADGRVLRGADAVRAYLGDEDHGRRPRTEVEAHEVEAHGDRVDVRGRIRVIGSGRVTDSPAAWTFTVRAGRVVQIIPLAAPAPAPVVTRAA
jgi:ketosteroid isomerase-like protein